MTISVNDRVLGCLLGGACGDALGAPFEFTPLFEMRYDYGSKEGVREFWTDGGKLGAISDDTQLVAFTTSALFASQQNGELSEIEHLHLAYLAWHSAGHGANPLIKRYPDFHAQLVDLTRRQGDRVPSVTTVESLMNARYLGSFAENTSMGSGAVTRVAPIGLLYLNDPEKAFDVAVACAKLTHGHEGGYLAAGAFAMLVAYAASGMHLPLSLRRVEAYVDHHKSRDLPWQDLCRAPWPSNPAERRASWIGYGWSGPEAFAIAVNAVMTTNNVEDAIVVACNHDGDSDTTASMAGNLAGAIYGPALPDRWLAHVEMRGELTQLASQLCRIIPWNSNVLSRNCDTHPAGN